MYSYDVGGNLLSVETYAYTTDETVTGTPVDTDSYTYGDSEWKDLLTGFNGEAITYDEIGNPLNYRDGLTFTWKYGRSLESITKTNPDNTTLNISYEYDQAGVRTKKTVNGVTTYYTVNGYTVLFEKTGESVKEYLYDGEENHIGFILNGITYLYKTNLQGDITDILDTTGTVVSSYTYDAWGNITSITGNQTVAAENPFRYRGYYYDNETGFYYLNSRYYDSETRRFLNADEIDVIKYLYYEFDFLNVFAYCNNNVANHIDLYGMGQLSFAGLGLQIDFGKFGVEVVWFGVSLKDILKNSKKMKLYVYGNLIDINLKKNQFESLVGKILKSPKNVLKGKNFNNNISTSLFLVYSFPSFKGADDYLGSFYCASIVFNHVKTSYAQGSSCCTFGLGFSAKAYSVGGSWSYYKYLSDVPKYVNKLYKVLDDFVNLSKGIKKRVL